MTAPRESLSEYVERHLATPTKKPKVKPRYEDLRDEKKRKRG